MSFGEPVTQTVKNLRYARAALLQGVFFPATTNAIFIAFKAWLN